MPKGEVCGVAKKAKGRKAGREESGMRIGRLLVAFVVCLNAGLAIGNYLMDRAGIGCFHLIIVVGLVLQHAIYAKDRK